MRESRLPMQLTEKSFRLFRPEQVHNQEHLTTVQHQSPQYALPPQKTQHAPSANQEKMLSVSGKKKCSHCGEELGNLEYHALRICHYQPFLSV